jgi:TetR/AcrR family transcriptional repressor of nem operon
MVSGMRQRRKQPAVTRRVILESAGYEFARHGYAGTGLEAVVRRAGLTKGALFHHFCDKRALAVAWIEDLLVPEIGERWIVPLEGLGSLDAVKVFFRDRLLEMDSADVTSALVMMTSSIPASEEAVALALERVFAAWREALASMLERGKGAGWIHRSIQPGAEAVFLVSAVAGFCVTSRPVMSESARRGCAAALDAYLETLRAQ